MAAVTNPDDFTSRPCLSLSLLHPRHHFPITGHRQRSALTRTAAMASSPVSRLPLRPRHPVNPSSSEGILVKLKANQGTTLSYSEPFRGSPLPQKHVHLHPVSDKVLLVLLVLCPPLQLLMLLMPGVLSPLPQLQPPGFLLLQQHTVLRAFAHVAHFQAPPSSPHPAIPSSQPHPH